MAAWTIARTARKKHRCANKASRGCAGVIAPGERYLIHHLTPNDPDVGNRRWLHSKECATCAAQYGRADKLDPAGAAP